ncbi:PTS sugar transporter subunit IIA [Tepidanaerobacter syntrophicus]|uniref:PTS sugar transporter subunit IIA n=1 Tax=Tepidanaerobacter syntrophicus TaxID=224999 RepID=UPI001BD24ABD|nr:PTS sugar transporter subunit IIA [Tepidanaerobacter syntrophicus]
MLLLEKIYKKKWYAFHDGFENWEDAVRASIQPLIETGAVKEEYADKVIECIHKYGPYVVIAPEVCIPHTSDKSCVNETSISFMKTNKPVDFGEDTEYKPRLFFALAAVDEQEHLNNLKALMEILSDEENIQKLLNINNAEDLLNVAQMLEKSTKN